MTEVHQRHPHFLDDQRKFFDELITESCESYFDSAWDATREFELANLFERISARRVLDLGCGIGFHDVVMANRYGVEEVVGIDYSPKSIEVAERTYPHPRVRREVSDIFDLPPGDFDLAVSFQVIEHLTRPMEFVRVCAGQVREGGFVAFFTPNRLRLENRLLRLRRREPQLADPQHFREFTRSELNALGRAAGLRSVGGFGYGLSVGVPRVHRQILPRRLGLRLGQLIPAIANGICVIFRNDWS